MSNKMSPGFMINEYMKAHKGEELMLNDVAKLMEKYANQECVDITSQLHIANTQAEFWENTARKGVSEFTTRRQLIDAINLLDDAPPGKGEWLNKVVDLRKRVLGCIEQSELPVNDISSSEGKPLGAAEMIKPFIEQVTEPDGTILDVIAPGRAAVISEQYADQQTAALREELERWKDKYEVSVEAGKVTNTELEAVKKELQGMKDDYHDIDEDGNHIGYGYWKDEYFRMQESARKYLKQLSEVTRQRDEAVKELEYARFIMPFHTGPEYKKWHEEFDKTISRLSSGETKPVREKEKGEFPCPVCESGTMYPLTNKPGHFCPYCKADAIPAPPESLTDKSKV